ncbi:hypothetical protein MMC18_003271 [Xylographa bjoerkii]|nr:hypothetical protein [Xylographa bjoerkii]
MPGYIASQSERGLDEVYVYLVERYGKKQWVLETEVGGFVQPKAASRSSTLKNQLDELRLSSRLGNEWENKCEDSSNSSKGGTTTQSNQLKQSPLAKGGFQGQKINVHDSHRVTAEQSTPRDAIASGNGIHDKALGVHADRASSSQEEVSRQPKNESVSDPAETDFEKLNRDIYIYPPGEGVAFSIPMAKKGEPYLVAAILDTACTVGNMISQELVHRLGMDEYVQPQKPYATDFHGRVLEFTGKISFRWKVRHGYTIHEPTTFLVSKMRFDVLFGVTYILKKKLVINNMDYAMPLIEHEPETLSEKQIMDIYAERQRQIKNQLGYGPNAQQQAAGTINSPNATGSRPKDSPNANGSGASSSTNNGRTSV